MKASNKLLRRAGLALLALGTLAGAFGFSLVLNKNTGLPIKWPAGTVRLKIMLGDTRTLIDNTTFNSSAVAAAQTWNNIVGSVQFQAELVAGSTTSPTDNNNLNELGFADKIFGKDFDSGTLAVTTGYSIGNDRAEADIIFNTAYTWDSYRGNLRGGASPVYDLQRVALHELGHVLGLTHPDEATPPQTVNAIMNSRIGNLDTLTNDDSEAVQHLYGPRALPSNDTFVNATIITLLNGNVTSVTGYNANATRETGEPRNVDNGGGRSVWWRWTAPSSGSVTLDTGKVDPTTKKIDLSGVQSSYFDTTLGVYTGSTVSSLTKVADSDDIDPGVIQVSKVTFDVTSGTTYRFSVDGWDGDCGGITLNLNFTSVGGTLPSITTQPASVTVNSGSSASFSVTATGTEPLSYQWQLGGVAISGATTASYSIASASSGQAGTYTVVVSNAAGSVTSNSATLTVNTPAPPPTPTPSGGGGGGGGAPSLWFVSALAAVGLGRLMRQRGDA